MGHMGQVKFGKAPTTALKTVTAGGTPERLVADNTSVKSCLVQALESNTGNVIIGDGSIDPATGQGIEITPLNSITLEGVDLYDWYVDADTNGEGVSLTYSEVLGNA